MVNAMFVVAVIFVLKRPLRAFLARDAELFGREDFFPFLVGLDYFVCHSNGLSSLSLERAVTGRSAARPARWFAGNYQDGCGSQRDTRSRRGDEADVLGANARPDPPPHVGSYGSQTRSKIHFHNIFSSIRAVHP